MVHHHSEQRDLDQVENIGDDESNGVVGEPSIGIAKRSQIETLSEKPRYSFNSILA